MLDTPRSLSELKTRLATNSGGLISAQDLRDFLVTALDSGGVLSCFEGSTAQTSIGTTPAIMSGFSTASSSDIVSADTMNDDLTCTIAGDYEVYFFCSFTGTNGASMRFRLYKNSTELEFGCTRDLGSTDIGTTGFKAKVTVAANDTLTVYVESDDGGNGDSMTPKEATFSARLIG